MKVTVKDFQILKDNIFEFPEGITVIQGKTGSGKTTLFYAIEDCLLNESGVDDAINWNAKQASVRIENNGADITWIKTGTSSEYINNLTQEHFVKASKLDSTDIADLGFYINNNDVVNVQSQWKKIFPFELKDTEMFRLFEDIFNISCSFNIIDDYKKDEQQIKSQISGITQQINTLNQEKLTIQNILDKININDINEIAENLNNQESTIKQLQFDYSLLLNNQKYINLFVPDSYNTVDLTTSDSYCSQINNDYNNYLYKQNLLKIELPEEQIFELQENIYENAYYRYLELQKVIETNDQTLQTLKQEEQNVRLKLKDIKICPTCGHRLEDHDI